MAKIFAILTALVLVVSGALAFLNKGEDEFGQQYGRGYQGWIKKREAEDASLARAQADLKDKKAELETTKGEWASVSAEGAKWKAEADVMVTVNEELKSKEDALEADAASKKAEVAQKTETFVGVGEVEQVIADLKRTQEQLATLNRVIDEGTAKRGGLEGDKRTTEASIDGLKGKISMRVSGKSDPKLRTHVRNVYRGLGFVTLAGGDNIGIVKDSRLDVIRDGEVIGKLQVTTVEASTAAADIVPDSMPPGGSVVAGDIVVAEKPKEITPPPVASSRPSLEPIEEEEEPAAEINPFG